MSFACDFKTPIVQTKAGKIHGFMQDDMFHFRGIKYAEAERFMPPTPVEPWEGVKDATVYGYVAPTITPPILKPYGMDMGMRYWPQNEACQYLNVWTPSLDENAKKPVMVWMHGGGFGTGSSLELESYDGTNLSRGGDVVVVSLNHRLNLLGYTNLSAFGEKYALSGTVGMADIVMALQWVHDNIAGFGGDPDNVTIFGQSGGGMKVTTTMQIPAANHLYKRAMIESGVADMMKENVVADSLKSAEAFVAELGLTKETIDEIQTMPLEQLIEAWLAVEPKLKAQGVSTMHIPVPNAYYLGDPFYVGFSDKAKETPLIVGTCMAETALWRGKFFNPADPEEVKLERIRENYGEEGAEKVLPLFKAAYPEKDINDIMYLDGMFRLPTIKYLDMRAATCSAPTYSWMLSYDFHFYGGVPAWHGSNHALTFNTCTAPVYHEDGARKLAVQFSSSWAAFAHTGNPNNPEIPEWHTYKTGSEATMVFDSKCEEKIDFDRALAEVHVQYAPVFRPRGG